MGNHISGSGAYRAQEREGVSDSNEGAFEHWLRKHRLKRTQRSCDLWNDAARAGWEARKEVDLAIVNGYTAPINSMVNGDQCAKEILEALDDI
jgi:hypothetical protein